MKDFKLALIGKDVSGSKSPQIHKFISERMGVKITYERISISEANFKKEIESVFYSFNGFNVTIPYKLSIIPYLNEIKEDAAVFGSVNTVVAKSRTGYNTDGVGFMLMLLCNGVEFKGKTALVLGAGGAGRSVAKKLTDSGANVYIYNRSFEKARVVAEEFKGVKAIEKLFPQKYDIIVNATGVGMHETAGISPVDEAVIKLCNTAVDLIYNPPESKFLEIARKLGKKTVNGAAMLFYQAYYSDCIYFDETPSIEIAKQLFSEYSKENNI